MLPTLGAWVQSLPDRETKIPGVAGSMAKTEPKTEYLWPKKRPGRIRNLLGMYEDTKKPQVSSVGRKEEANREKAMFSTRRGAAHNCRYTEVKDFLTLMLWL